VTRSYVPLLLVLGAIWGASFLFIEEADQALEPTTIMAGRLLLAAAVLVPVLLASTGLRESWRALRAVALVGLVSGIVNAALPFTLIAWGQKHIDSGTAAIANASMPIFVVLLAWRVRRSESARGLRLVGVLLGFLGVGVLAGANPPGGAWGVIGTLAVVLAAFCYAVGALYAQHHIGNVPVLVFSTAQCIAGALVPLPFGIAQLPAEVPGGRRSPRWSLSGSPGRRWGRFSTTGSSRCTGRRAPASSSTSCHRSRSCTGRRS
jgi:drug/metabolite transporter (DMT)-like permease